MPDLSLYSTLALAGLVFLAGFVDSIAGGGGLISLPAYFAFGLPPHIALATNKFSGFAGTSTAVLRYYQAGRIRLRTGLAAALGALVGSAVGSRIALWTSEEAIRLVMLILVPSVLVFFLFQKKILPQKKANDEAVAHEAAKAGAIGFVVGAYDGFFGPGTGAFLTIAFFAILRFDLVTCSANARLANMASNAGALIVFLVSGKVAFPLAFYCAAAGIAGNLVGSRLAIKKGESVVRPLLIFVLLLLLIQVIRNGAG